MPRKRSGIICEKDLEICHRPECREHGCMDQTYEVTVWDMREGDIVKKLWDADAVEMNEVRDQYIDEPFMEVHIEAR